MARHHFEPHQIPKQLTFTLYMTYGVGKHTRGAIRITDYWSKEDKSRKSKFDRDWEYILLAEFSVTVDVPEGIDPAKRYIEVLKNERRRLLAQHHIELKSIDDTIARAKAIEFKPETEAAHG